MCRHMPHGCARVHEQQPGELQAMVRCRSYLAPKLPQHNLSLEAKVHGHTVVLMATCAYALPSMLS